MTTLQRSSLLVAILALGAVAVLLFQIPVPAGHPNRQGELEVTLTASGFDPTHLYLPTETPVTLRLVNQANGIHELALIRAASGSGGDFLGLLDDLAVEVDPATARISPTEEHPYTGFRVQVDETVTVRFTLPAARAGEWEVGCLSAGGCYYDLGFHIPVTVG
jgi:hypothetical protein